jgi:hypothetical protein
MTGKGRYDRLRNARPVVVDLCCGNGGWARGFLAEGFRVIGIDIVGNDSFPGELMVRDVRSVCGADFDFATVFVASPPCDEFSRHDMPWTLARNPPPPDLSIVEACWRIAREAGRPIVLENVRGAQKFLGPARAHFGKQYLWGDVPALLPDVGRGQSFGRQKQSLTSSAKLRRAEIPFELANHVARCFLPSPVAIRS